jgi:hypothetical protein
VEEVEEVEEEQWLLVVTAVESPQLQEGRWREADCESVWGDSFKLGGGEGGGGQVGWVRSVGGQAKIAM